MKTEDGGSENLRDRPIPVSRYVLWIAILGAIPTLLVFKNKIAGRQNTYTLFRRTERDPETEARKILGVRQPERSP